MVIDKATIAFSLSSHLCAIPFPHRASEVWPTEQKGHRRKDGAWCLRWGPQTLPDPTLLSPGSLTLRPAEAIHASCKEFHVARNQGLLPTARWLGHCGSRCLIPARLPDESGPGWLCDYPSWETLVQKHPLRLQRSWVWSCLRLL